MIAGKFKGFILILVLAAVSFGIYANSLNGDFLVDDTPVIVDNERIHDLKVYFSKHFGLRVNILNELAWVFIWHLAGPNPFYYHLFNVLVHLFCVIALFILCNLLFKNSTLSFLASLIFAVHPIHTEAISWISGGHYAFSSLFYIAAIIFYIRAEKSALNFILSIATFILCLLTGNAVATLPIMFILYDLFFREKVAGNARLRRLRIITLSVILSISAIFVFTYFVRRNEFMHIIFYYRGPRYLVVVAKAFAYYLRILYMPLVRGLFHPFAFNANEIQRISPVLFFTASVLIISAVSFFKCKRRFIPISFGIMWFFVTFLPFSNIIPICNIVSERYLYLPSVGFSMIMAALFLKVWEIIDRNPQYRAVLRFACIVIITLFLGSYSFLTLMQNYEYNNIITYWESNIKNFPDGYMVYNNLAGTYYLMGQKENAIAYCWINLLVNDKQPHVWYNLGNVYREIGNLEKAQECFQQVLKIYKNYFPAYKALEEIEAQ
ncbi:MAG: tetratricopeptide repeat protein [Candidatus Omnitrophica bacterium]|nr:tetratricopeptide repeat protein [Candidatus Omnitrophota bacterium]